MHPWVLLALCQHTLQLGVVQVSKYIVTVGCVMSVHYTIVF